MPKEINLPQLGQTMEEGTIISVSIKVGDKVSKGQVIFEVETDKAVLEMESPSQGFVKHILVKESQTVPVGELMAILGEENEQVELGQKAAPAQQAAAKPEPAPAAQVTTPAPAKVEPAQADKQKVSPRAKMTAAQMGIDIKSLMGTGPGGRVVEADILKAAPAAAPKITGPASGPKLGDTIDMGKMQQLIGQRMLQSKQNIPCFYLSTTIDVTDLVAYRTKRNAITGTKVSYNDFIIKALGLAAMQYPIMAGKIVDGKIKLANSVDIGLAVAVTDGLVAPIVKRTETSSLDTIAADIAALVQKAKNNKLNPADLNGGSITVSNLGAFGIDFFTPIVIPGQTSILGVGNINDVLVPVMGGIEARKKMIVTLSVDHSIANGDYAARFLATVKGLLETPAALEQ